MFHMLDAMLAMFIDLPARMNPGVSTCISNCRSEFCFTIVFCFAVKVFLASSDIILLYNGAGMLTVMNCLLQFTSHTYYANYPHRRVGYEAFGYYSTSSPS